MISLENEPDKVFDVRDDVEAKALLLHLGIMDKFPRQPALAPGVGWVARAYDDQHPTHRILAVRYSGFAEASDNGFVVLCLPKSRFSLEAANAVLRANGLIPPAESVEYYADWTGERPAN